jgi:hypothetical protein
MAFTQRHLFEDNESRRHASDIANSHVDFRYQELYAEMPVSRSGLLVCAEIGDAGRAGSQPSLAGPQEVGRKDKAALLVQALDPEVDLAHIEAGRLEIEIEIED